MSKPGVYITREVNKDAVDLLEKTCEVAVWTGKEPVPKAELLKNVKGKQALFCMLTDKIDKEVLDAGSELKVIATMSVGYDHLDVAEIKARSIKIGYTPDVLTDATTELTVALLLATSRRLFEANEAATTGEWSAWSPFWMCGPGLAGATVGIVGLGRIGASVALCLKSFNPAQILYTSRTEKPEAVAFGGRKVQFDELLRESDFVIATSALTPETTKLFDKAAFAKMKRTAIFVNTSRGGLVDQDALVEALRDGTIRAAGLDVMTPEPLLLDSPLLALRNCVVLPHIGSASIRTRELMGLLTARNVVAGIEGTPLPSELKV